MMMTWYDNDDDDMKMDGYNPKTLKTIKNAAYFKVFDITTSESIANYNIKRLSRTPKNGPKNEI